ncbi:MAG: AI-2E family transporter [Cyanobacteria bacterium P01_A01_bin.84]
MSSSESRNFFTRLNIRTLVRFLLLIACGWTFIKLLAYFEPIIIIFTFATILAFLLNYPVKWLQRFLPRNLAVVVIFVLGIIIIGTLVITVSLGLLSQGQELTDSVAAFLSSLVPFVEKIEEILRDRNLPIDLGSIEQILRNQAISRLMNVLAIFQGFLTNFATFILIAVVSFFMLLEGEQIWELTLKIIPESKRQRFANLIKRNFLGFFRGQLLLTLFLTISTFLVFLVLNVPFPLVLSVIVGLIDIIPGIGATLGISVITAIVLSQGVWLAIKVLAACIVLQQIQDNLIAPRIMQDALNLNPVVIFFSLLIGARVAGLLGIFISIPIAGVVVSLFEIDEMKSEV